MFCQFWVCVSVYSLHMERICIDGCPLWYAVISQHTLNMQIGRLATQYACLAATVAQHKILVAWQIKQRTIQMICNTFENKHVTQEKILTGTPACCAHLNVSVFETQHQKKVKHQCFRNSNDKLEYDSLRVMKMIFSKQIFDRLFFSLINCRFCLHSLHKPNIEYTQLRIGNFFFWYHATSTICITVFFYVGSMGRLDKIAHPHLKILDIRITNSLLQLVMMI